MSDVLPSFRVYVDEAGDEGFVFKSDGSGSTRWLVLSAVIVRAERDLELVEVVKAVRTVLGKPTKHPLHFRELKHEQRVPYVKRLAAAPIRTVSVLVHKPDISAPERFMSEPHLRYRYATRLLLERVSWLCRDHRRDGVGDGFADVVFSNRKYMSYDDVRGYLRLLHDQSDPLEVRIDWTVIDPARVRAVDHDKRAGLQAADAVATGLFYAVTRNRYDEVEESYATALAPNFYRHRGVALSYGLKFWPIDLAKMRSANPALAKFADR